MPIARRTPGVYTALPAPFFSTTFPLTQNPISQSGIFTTGNNSGANAAIGPQSSGGACYAQAADGIDYLGTLQSRFSTTKHYAEATVKRTGGYTAPSTQEIEL